MAKRVNDFFTSKLDTYIKNCVKKNEHASLVRFDDTIYLITTYWVASVNAAMYNEILKPHLMVNAPADGEYIMLGGREINLSRENLSRFFNEGGETEKIEATGLSKKCIRNGVTFDCQLFVSTADTIYIDKKLAEMFSLDMVSHIYAKAGANRRTGITFAYGSLAQIYILPVSHNDDALAEALCKVYNER